MGIPGEKEFGKKNSSFHFSGFLKFFSPGNEDEKFMRIPGVLDLRVIIPIMILQFRNVGIFGKKINLFLLFAHGVLSLLIPCFQCMGLAS